jgi:hypothetical protein
VTDPADLVPVARIWKHTKRMTHETNVRTSFTFSVFSRIPPFSHVASRETDNLPIINGI